MKRFAILFFVLFMFSCEETVRTWKIEVFSGQEKEEYILKSKVTFGNSGRVYEGRRTGYLEFSVWEGETIIISLHGVDRYTIKEITE